MIAVCRVTQCASFITFFYENRYSALLALQKNPILHLSDKAISQAVIKGWFKKLEDKASDAPSKCLQRRMTLAVVDELVEIVG